MNQIPFTIVINIDMGIHKFSSNQQHNTEVCYSYMFWARTAAIFSEPQYVRAYSASYVTLQP